MNFDVLITGANRGIGLELARQLSERGDRVVATCRNPDAATELAALDVEVAGLDVTDLDAMARLVASLQDRPLDILINNAGIGGRGRGLGGLDFERIERCWRTNSLAPLRLTEALLPRLRAGRRKLIVNMTSRMGSIADNGSGGSYGYRASKAALNMFARSLAIDLAPEGFTCVVLHPGWVQTDMGGPGAPTATAESVRGLVSVIDRVGQSETGMFFDHTGAEVPW